MNSSHLIVDLNQLQKNIADLKSHFPDKKILFMTKANAYGHGDEAIVKAAREVGVEHFGFASLDEAVSLRTKISYESHFYVFSNLDFENRDSRSLYKDKKIIPMISSLTQLDLFLSDESLVATPLCIHLDTGMNRLGVNYQEIDKLIGVLIKKNRKDIFYLGSHYSDSFLTKNSNKNKAQVRRFKEALDHLRNREIRIENVSLANSGAIEQKMVLGFETIIRPGLMLYGPSSLLPQTPSELDWRDRHISSLRSKIIDIKEVSKGDPVGYGSSPCPNNGLLYMLPLGYEDGLRTNFAGKKILVNNKEARIVGRVSMDMMQFMFDDPKNTLKLNDTVEIWSLDGKGLQFICQQNQMIPYEILCSLGARVHRKYCSF